MTTQENGRQSAWHSYSLYAFEMFLVIRSPLRNETIGTVQSNRSANAALASVSMRSGSQSRAMVAPNTEPIDAPETTSGSIPASVRAR